MENYKLIDHKLNQCLLKFTDGISYNFQECESFGFAALDCQENFYQRFIRSILLVKKSIINVVDKNSCNLNERQQKNLRIYLKPLTTSFEQLQLNILGIYQNIANFIKDNQSSENKANQTFDKLIKVLKIIIKQLSSLLFYYFVHSQFQKRKKQISSHIASINNQISSQKNVLVANQKKKINMEEDEQILCLIQQEFSKVNLSSLLKNYLKIEKNSLIDSIQVCKICSQQIKLRNFKQHIKACCKKAQLEIELKELEEQRKKFFDQVQQRQKNILFQKSQPTQKDLCLLRIFYMIKQAFLSYIKKSLLKRNSLLCNSKKDLIQEIQEQILSYSQKYQKDILLSNILINAQKIITIKNRLYMMQIISKTKIDINKDEDEDLQFKLLQQSINNTKIKNICLKTKKTIEQSKLNEKKVGFQKSINSRRYNKICSSLSINTQSSVSISESILNDSQTLSQNSLEDNDDLHLKKNTSIVLNSSAIQKSKKSQQQNKENYNYKSLKILCSLEDLSQQIIGLSDFDILKFLGKGAYGKVYLVRRKITKDFYALKQITFEDTPTENSIQLIRKQHQIFKKTAGDHIIKAPFAFSETYGHFFVLQFMPGGDLSKILNKQVYLNEQQAKFYLAEIVLALQYLHKNNIIHRDLKPQNIVIDKKGHIKLTDFGLSEIKIKDKLFKAKQKLNFKAKKLTASRTGRRSALINRRDIAKIIGTPDYIAPQIINQTSINNHSIDWWSLGVLAYQILVGCRPFSAMTIDEILQNIIYGQIEWPQIGRQDQMMSPQAYDLISRLLDKNFQKRIGSKSCLQIKQHPFFKGINWEDIKNQQPPFIPLSQLNYFQKYKNLPQDLNLKKQIINSNKNKINKIQSCIGLNNFVRYDVLIEQTCQSIEQKLNKSKQRIKKIKTLTEFIEQQQRVLHVPCDKIGLYQRKPQTINKNGALHENQSEKSIKISQF